jgi:hypothetical protein
VKFSSLLYYLLLLVFLMLTIANFASRCVVGKGWSPLVGMGEKVSFLIMHRFCSGDCITKKLSSRFLSIGRLYSLTKPPSVASAVGDCMCIKLYEPLYLNYMLEIFPNIHFTCCFGEILAAFSEVSEILNDLRCFQRRLLLEVYTF